MTDVGARAAQVYLFDGATLKRRGEFTHVESIDRSFVHVSPQRIDQASLVLGPLEPLIPDLDPRAGDLIVITSTMWPDPWVGVFHEWGQAGIGGKVTVEVSGYPRVLQDRRIGALGDFSGTAGSIAASILQGVNATNWTGINLGFVGIGPQISGTLSDMTAFEALNQVTEQSGLEWWLEFRLGEALESLTIFLNVDQQRGFDYVTAFGLVEGGHKGSCDVLDWRQNAEAAAFSQTVVGGYQTSAQISRPRSVQVASVGATTGFGGGFDGNYLGEGSLRNERVGDRSVGNAGALFGRYQAPRTVNENSPVSRREMMRQLDHLRTPDHTTMAARVLQLRSEFQTQVIRLLAYPTVDKFRFLRPGNVILLNSLSAFACGYEGPVRIVAAVPDDEAIQTELVVHPVRLGPPLDTLALQ